MWNKIVASVRKEILILLRDRLGLTLLFLMPLALVIIMALIQDAPFRDFYEQEVAVAILDEDSGAVAVDLIQGLQSGGVFKVTKIDGRKGIQELKLRTNSGEFAIGIHIPPQTSIGVRNGTDSMMTEIFSGVNTRAFVPVELGIYVDPATKHSFRNALMSSLREFSREAELRYLMQAVDQQLAALNPDRGEQQLRNQHLIVVKEQSSGSLLASAVTNSTQHNVPAWTIFAIFFMVVPLSGSIIKEREQGSYLRIRTMPVSMGLHYGAKVVTYVLVCTVQTILITLAGYYVLPSLGLPSLVIGGSLVTLTVGLLSVAMAACSLGVAVGSSFDSYQQASTFSAVLIVILAALGGIWIPVDVMPDALAALSLISPLYWSLELMHTVFLRGGGIDDISRQVLVLSCFSFVMLFVAVLQKRR